MPHPRCGYPRCGLSPRRPARRAWPRRRLSLLQALLLLYMFLLQLLSLLLMLLLDLLLPGIICVLLRQLLMLLLLLLLEFLPLLVLLLLKLLLLLLVFLVKFRISRVGGCRTFHRRKVVRMDWGRGAAAVFRRRLRGASIASGRMVIRSTGLLGRDYSSAAERCWPLGRSH
jgi:hypothetical protein